jgi:aspartate carbamoyltransferase catalytic subunit
MDKNPQKILGEFNNKDILSIDQFDKVSFQYLFSFVPKMKKAVEAHKKLTLIDGNVVALLFFEPSSRTFTSFASAVKRVGGETLESQNLLQTSSMVKGETFEDTIKVIETYSDLIIMRHPEPFSAEKAAVAATRIPIINAGDGAHEHPTQTLLDMYTLFEKFGSLNHLTGVMAGDLLYGRTVHSLLKALSFYEGNTLYLLSPKQLKMPLKEFDKSVLDKLTIVEIEDENELPKDANFWYWTRVQKERFKNHSEYEKLKNKFILSNKLLNEKGNKNLFLMHPLPRIGEVLQEVDADPRAIYLTDQIRNGLFIRMALVSLVLGRL